MLNKNEFVNAISQTRGWSIESHHACEYSISSQWNDEFVQLSWKITLHAHIHRMYVHICDYRRNIFKTKSGTIGD